jgi:hypothetical protein
MAADAVPQGSILVDLAIDKVDKREVHTETLD